MDRVYHSARCLQYTFNKNALHAKVLVLLFALYMYMEMTVGPIALFAKDNALSVNMFGLFGVLMSDVLFTMISGIACMVLVSEAPFFDAEQQYVLLRSGKIAWLVGQLLYLFIVIALYLLFMFAVMVIHMWPNVSFDQEWGVALTTWGRNGLPEQYRVYPVMSSSIMAEYTARRAFLYSMVLRWASWSICAMVLFLCNTMTNKRIGLIFATLLLMADVLVASQLPYYYYRFSIPSLARLSIVGTGYHQYYPSMKYACICLSCLLAFMTCLCTIFGKKTEMTASNTNM